MADTQGRFVWYELMTSDVEAAKSFYTEVIGWKTKAWEGPGDYTMWVAGEFPIGGVMTLPDEVKQMGVPPHWMGHVRVDSADAAVKKVEELGGKVLRPPEDIPEVGRFAIVADPQGAALSLFQPEREMPPGDGKARGEISWHELNTTDYESAWKFYSGLFGWKETDSMDMGEGMGTYFMFTSQGQDTSMGGMSNIAKAQGFPPSWLFYANVEDIDAAVERVKNNGGAVMNGPMDVPGGGKIAQCTDPQGAAFALYAEDK